MSMLASGPTTVELVTAWGTAGVFVIAAFVFALDVITRLLRRWRGQAEQVTAWIGEPKPGTDAPSAVWVANGSNALIAEVEIFETVRPVEKGSIVDVLIPPGHTQAYPSDFDRQIFTNVAVRVQFLDGRGLGWAREMDGRLRRVRRLDVNGFWALWERLREPARRRQEVADAKAWLEAHTNDDGVDGR